MTEGLKVQVSTSTCSLVPVGIRWVSFTVRRCPRTRKGEPQVRMMIKPNHGTHVSPRAFSENINHHDLLFNQPPGSITR